MLRYLILPVLLLTACGGNSPEPTPVPTQERATVTSQVPERAMEHLLTMLSDGQYPRAYAMVHPLYQEEVDQETFVRCNAASPFTLVSFNAVETHTADVVVSGQTIKGTGVTADVTLDPGGTFRDTLYFAQVEGEWRALIRDLAFYENC